jgi:hypothetical protein
MLSTSCRMPGLALRTRALHWRSSVPEPLSSRAAQPICSPSCSTTTHAQFTSARSHPTRVPWQPGPMRSTIPNLRPHPTVARTNPRAVSISSCVPSNPPARCAGRQRRPCDSVAPCAPCALVRCSQTAWPPRSRARHQLASRDAHRSSPEHCRPRVPESVAARPLASCVQRAAAPPPPGHGPWPRRMHAASSACSRKTAALFTPFQP